MRFELFGRLTWYFPLEALSFVWGSKRPLYVGRLSQMSIPTFAGPGDILHWGRDSAGGAPYGPWAGVCIYFIVNDI